VLKTAVDQAEPDQLGEGFQHVGRAEADPERPGGVAPRPGRLDQRHRMGGGQRLGDLGHLAALDRVEGGHQDVEEAVVGEAGLRVGVPQRVPQAGREPERQPPVPAGADHRGQLDRGREEFGGEPADPELRRDRQPGLAGGGQRVQAGQQPPAQWHLGEHFKIQVGGERTQGGDPWLRVLAAAGHRRLDVPDIRPGRAQFRHRGGQNAHRGVVDQADHRAGRRELPVDQRRRQQERSEQFLIPGPLVFGVLGQDLAERRAARRQRRRIVDEPCEQRRHQR
jgi:hypothetical protein